jgi:hypothetical protein
MMQDPRMNGTNLRIYFHHPLRGLMHFALVPMIPFLFIMGFTPSSLAGLLKKRKLMVKIRI